MLKAILYYHSSSIMEQLPYHVYIVFALTLAATLFLFYKAANKSKGFLLLISIWIILQSIMGIAGLYTNTNASPPLFPLLIVPPLLFTVVQFLTKKGRQFIDGMDISFLTLIHIIRIPVEIVLFWLFIHKAVPQLMTFEGRNFDIISGITAPVLYYIVFIKRFNNKALLISWNILGLVLLLNIVIHALLSAPLPFQQFAFDQPNRAVLHFPFIFLPCCIVPLILFSHLAALRKLLLKPSL